MYVCMYTLMSGGLCMYYSHYMYYVNMILEQQMDTL